MNVDIEGKYDVKHDLNVFPYPFKDNIADEINIDHVIEHLLYPKKAIRECYRILKKGCDIYIGLPPYSNTPEHTNMIHNQLYLRNLYVKSKNPRVHPKYYDEVFFSELLDFGYKDKLPFTRMGFQMYLRFISWVKSFKYQTIYWRLKK